MNSNNWIDELLWLKVRERTKPFGNCIIIRIENIKHLILCVLSISWWTYRCTYVNKFFLNKWKHIFDKFVVIRSHFLNLNILQIKTVFSCFVTIWNLFWYSSCSPCYYCNGVKCVMHVKIYKVQYLAWHAFTLLHKHA